MSNGRKEAPGLYVYVVHACMVKMLCQSSKVSVMDGKIE